MNPIFKHSLQRTMIIYFVLIGFASVLVGIEFTMDTNRKELKEEIISNFDKYSKGMIEKDQIFYPIDKLRNKAILMILIILFVTIIVITMFIKNITEPLQHMIELSKLISKGDLSQTIKIHSNNELAELGNVINELSSNLQEVLLLSKNASASVNDFVVQMSDKLNKKTIYDEDIVKVKEEISNMKKEFELLSEIIEYFSFYTIERTAKKIES